MISNNMQGQGIYVYVLYTNYLKIYVYGRDTLNINYLQILANVCPGKE